MNHVALIYVGNSAVRYDRGAANSTRREVWQHEALDFTTWLERNLDVLTHALDITLSGAEQERSAGASFFAQYRFDEEPAGSNRLTLASTLSTIRGSSIRECCCF